jgi:hypothetical protein
VFGGTEPGQSRPYRLVVADQQPAVACVWPSR